MSTLETDQRTGKPAVKLSLPLLGSISSALAILLYVGGFATGYITFKSEMASLRDQVGDLRSGTTVMQDRLNSLGNRLTSIESDTKYISQGIAELRLASIPRK